MTRPRPWHYTFDEAVRKSDLPGLARHVLMTLNTYTDKQGHIPDRFQPSISQLARETGWSRPAVLKGLGIAESAGWVQITRAQVAQQIREKARNHYRLLVPTVDGVNTTTRGGHSMTNGGHNVTEVGHNVDTSQHSQHFSHGATQPPRAAGDAGTDVADAIDEAGEEWAAQRCADEMLARGEAPERVAQTIRKQSKRLGVVTR